MKKFLSVCLSVLMVLSVIPFSPAYVTVGATDSAENQATSGTLGEYCHWELDGTVLTISCDTETYIEGVNSSELPWGNNITEVIIKNGITHIGNSAFYNCKDLKKVTIPDSVTDIGSETFYGCTALESITIPGSIKSIGDSAFRDCSSLKNVDIQNGVERINYSVFQGCTSLTDIIIPNSVMFLGGNAFADCSLLSNITLPENAIDISSYVFTDTAYYSNSQNWENGVLYIGNHLIKADQNIKGSYTVKAGTLTIVEYAFQDCHDLESITIPNGTLRIGSDAFRNCSYLKSIVLPNSITHIGQYAFSETEYYYNEKSWKNGALYIGNHLIKVNDNLPSNYEIKNGTLTIADYAFEDKNSIEEVTIPNTVTHIGEYAFNWCYNLKNLTIPNSVTDIGEYAFYECRELTSVTFGSGLINLGEAAFSSCYNLNKIHIPSIAFWCNLNFTDEYNNPLYENMYLELYLDGELITDLVIPEGVTKIGDYAFYNYGHLKSVTIPNSVTSIGKYAFYTCDYNLTTVNFGSGLKTIGDYAFSSCSSIESIDLPDKLESIGDHAFSYCSIYSITIPDSVVSLGNSAFANCSLLNEVKFGSGLKHIGNYAFSGCQSITDITIPNGVTTIGFRVFNCCQELTSITIPPSVTNIKGDAFSECYALSTVNISDLVAWCSINFENTLSSPLLYGATLYLNGEQLINLVIPEGVTEIADYAFFLCDDIETLVIPNSVTYIGEYAFNSCSSLREVTMSNRVTYIGDYAFNYCSNITNLDIPDTVTYIGDYAFNACYCLEEVNIPSGITKLGERAFYDCDSITEITIPSSLVSLDNGAFTSCNNLKTINLESDDYFAVVDGVLFSSDKTTIVCYPSGKKDLTEYTVPNTVTTIGNYAFSVSYDLEKITLPNSVTKIGDNAFQACYNLKEVNIPNSVTAIGEFAFADCNSIKSITIPKSITSFGDSAFAYCTSLENVTLQDGLTSLGEWMFLDCSLLNTISIPDSVITLNCNTFTNSGYYQNEENWVDGVLYIGNHLIEARSFAEIADYAIKDGTKVIATDAFSYCNSLQNVVIPNSVISICDSAFENCFYLENVSLPNAITIINPNTFKNCNRIRDIVIPDSVITIDDRAFMYCHSLESLTLGKGIKNIGTSAFNGCQITELHIPDIETWCNINYKNPADIPTIHSSLFSLSLYLGDEYLTNLVIPEGITKIPAYAFYNCSNIQTVTIPSTVTSIGENAFYHCNIDSVEINNLAAWCKIDFANKYSNPIIQSDYLYLNGEELTNLVIPEGVTEIKDYAFCSFTRLESVTIPSGVTSIGVSAFEFCYSLYNITLPSSVTEIKENAFYDTNPEMVYYFGSAKDKSKINIAKGNDALSYAEWQYNSCTVDGGHVFDGVCDSECNNGCGFERVPPHSYDNDCDTACNLCEDTRTTDGHKVKTEINDFTFENSKDYPFSVKQGVYTSTNKDAFSESTATFTVSADSLVEIAYSTSTEEGYDELIINHNGTNLVFASGETPTTTESIYASAGDEIQITYSKDGGVYEGKDEISFTFKQFTLTPVDSIKPTCAAIVCGVCDTVIKEGSEHTYTDDLDASCNACGHIRAGDINSNGSINLIDLVTLARYVAGWDVEINNTEAADLNRDGVIDLVDVNLFARYLAGWKETELV